MATQLNCDITTLKIFSYCNPIIEGCELFTGNTKNFDTTPDGYYSDNKKCYKVVDGTVESISDNCDPTKVLVSCSYGDISGMRIQKFISKNEGRNKPIGLYVGEWSYQIIDFVINGVQFGTNQVLTFVTPQDAKLGFYKNNPNAQYVTNIEDWINAICNGTGLEFYNDKTLIEYPPFMTFKLVVRRLYGDTKWDYWYTSDGFGIANQGETPDSLTQPNCVIINNG